MKKSILITFIITLLVINNSKATDIMAGEITFKSINYLTYEIVIETYTNTSGGDERDTIEINFGDGTKELIARISKFDFGNDIQYNKYVGTHTYTGSGTFIIHYEDHNRIAGIRNIPNSEMAPFIIESKLSISTAIEWNKSVIYSGKSLTLFAEIGKIFVDNPGAYDPDGDSLAFTLITPGGVDQFGYYIPVGLTLDTFTGELSWDFPDTIGFYSIAIFIEEFRNGFSIGYIIRDMLIIVSHKVGISEDNQFSAQITVLPNPNNGKFRIIFKDPLFDQIHLEIIDVYGRNVYSSELSSDNEINLPFEAKGIYFLKFSTEYNYCIKKILCE